MSPPAEVRDLEAEAERLTRDIEQSYDGDRLKALVANEAGNIIPWHMDSMDAISSKATPNMGMNSRPK